MKKQKFTHDMANSARIAPAPILGGDIEYFPVLNGKVIPADAEGFFPLKDDDAARASGDVFEKFFADGVQAEINFHPYGCRDAVVYSIAKVLSSANRHAKQHNGSSLHAFSGVKMTQKEIDVGGMLSHVMGCNPDFSAYSDVPNRPVEDFAHHPIRYAGFHVQFGLDIPPDKEKMFAKLCDRTIGLLSTWGDKDETHILRKGDGVGLAGCYRNHPGRAGRSRFEYRTPGSWWSRRAFQAHFLFGIARVAAKAWNAGVADAIVSQLDDDEVRAAINNCDRKSSRRLAMSIMPMLCGMSGGSSPLNPKPDYVDSHHIELAIDFLDKFETDSCTFDFYKGATGFLNNYCIITKHTHDKDLVKEMSQFIKV